MSGSVLIVDDSFAFRYAVRCCIEANTQLQVCGEAENGKVAVYLVRLLTPDLVILDVLMPIMNGLEAAREIAIVSPKTKIILFTANDSSQLQERAGKLGVQAVLLKSGEDAMERLLRALKEVAEESFAA